MYLAFLAGIYGFEFPDLAKYISRLSSKIGITRDAVGSFPDAATPIEVSLACVKPSATA